MITSPKRGSWVRRVAENPVLNLIVGIFLLISGLLESLEPLLGTASPIGVHHGAVLFGLIHFMKWLPDMFKGIQFVEHGSENPAVQSVPGG
jgi:hypothetical protein